MQLVHEGIVSYTSPGYRESDDASCKIKILKDDLRYFVLVTELDSNQGCSITNCADSLIQQIREKFRLEGIVDWFECYPDNPRLETRFTKYLGNGVWKPSNEREREILACY